MRRAASCGHPWHEIRAPRGARTVLTLTAIAENCSDGSAERGTSRPCRDRARDLGRMRRGAGAGADADRIAVPFGVAVRLAGATRLLAGPAARGGHRRAG